MCPTAERRSAGFTLLELLIVLVIMGVLVAVGAGALSVERNPLYTGAQALVTASSTARSRALLLNAPVTLELGQTFMEISSENGDRPLREAFPKGMSAASVDEHYLLGGSQKLLFHPLGVVQEHVVHLQSGQDTLSVYIPATGLARILEGSFSGTDSQGVLMMSAHRPVPQPTPSRQAPFRFAAAALLCRFFVLIAASGCTPMRKQGAVPTFPASTMNDAVESYREGRLPREHPPFQHAAATRHPALLNGLGMAYLSCNQPRNAAQAFERAVSISPGSAALHTNAGTALYAANDYKSAERQFDAALRIDPTNPEALVGKAGILIQQKEPEKALRQLSLVSGTDAASPEVLYNKALAMYQMGLTDDAGTDLGTYAREHPNDAEAQNALGVVMLRAGNYASAKAHLDRAIALRPEQGEYYYNRANVLKEQKEFKAAIDDYTRAVAFIPDLAGAYINRGDAAFLFAA